MGRSYFRRWRGAGCDQEIGDAAGVAAVAVGPRVEHDEAVVQAHGDFVQRVEPDFRGGLFGRKNHAARPEVGPYRSFCGRGEIWPRWVSDRRPRKMESSSTGVLGFLVWK